jgi:hypothetical protein
MNKRVSLTVLFCVTLGVMASHLSWVERDNGHLLLVDAREVDVLGQAENQWVRLRRSCEGVAQLSPHDAGFQQAQAVIQAYSPPHSQSARLAGVWTTGDWSLVEVEFTQLLPAVVLIHTTGTRAEIMPDAVWSGYTKPWMAAPYIRRYVGAQATGVPARLLDCFEPQSEAFL